MSETEPPSFDRKKKRHEGAFSSTPNPLFDAKNPQEENMKGGFKFPEGERKGPFFTSKQMNEEEKKLREEKKAKKQAKYDMMIESGNYDKQTRMISMLLFKMWPTLAFIYLWRFQLFNAGIIEGTGILIYYAFLPLFQLMFGNIYLAITFTIPISFLVKFFLYKATMFKKVGQQSGT